ncbi:MAG: hypothetical protein KAT81_03335 [Syntrophobacterales bacterium]|nr:hypothetical protein [Syntrophobacterales bacterium]
MVEHFPRGQKTPDMECFSICCITYDGRFNRTSAMNNVAEYIFITTINMKGR